MQNNSDLLAILAAGVFWVVLKRCGVGCFSCSLFVFNLQIVLVSFDDQAILALHYSSMSDTQHTKGSPADPQSEVSLQGRIFEPADLASCISAIELAFDYRGDVTITTVDGQALEGYIFDRQSKVAQPYLRLMLKSDGRKERIAYERIRQIAFTGKDTAEGRSWETWVKNYMEKKARGEAASIEATALDGEG